MDKLLMIGGGLLILMYLSKQHHATAIATAAAVPTKTVPQLPAKQGSQIIDSGGGGYGGGDSGGNIVTPMLQLNDAGYTDPFANWFQGDWWNPVKSYAQEYPYAPGVVNV